MIDPVDQEQRIHFADLLLEQSAAAQPGDLLRSEELARLAFAIAEPIVTERWAGKANDVKARACVLVGNARRLSGRAEEAEQMFRQARLHLTGPPDCPERAFYCRHMALLRQDLGQLDEAAGLLWRASSIYRENGELGDEGVCMAQLGFLFLEEDQIVRAVPPLTRACQTLDRSAVPERYVRSALALAFCHASLAEDEACRRLLDTARLLYGRLSGAGAVAYVAWFEGKVIALTGEPEDALGFLSSARGTFLGCGCLYAAIRVSIDLGVLLAGMGRGERVQVLMDELLRATAHPEHIAAVFGLGQIADAARKGTDLHEAVERALSRLRCCRRDPIRSLGDWPPELSGTVARGGCDVDPSLAATAPDLVAQHTTE